MKYTHAYPLFLMFVFCTSCGQNKPDLPKNNINSNRANSSESQLKENSAGEQAVSLAETSKVPVSMVRNIKQARNGDILIAASWDGVFRYDGKSFTNLTSSKIGSHRFWDVLEDRRGNLWFASTDFGIYYYPSASLWASGKFLYNGQGGFQHFTTREGLVNNLVFSIYEDKTGNIWFGTGGGVSRYDGKSFRNFTTKDGLPDNGVKAIIEDKTGKLWFATGGGLCFFDGKTFTVLKNKDGKAFNNVWSIIEDKKGGIWFGDVDGLWCYEPSSSLRAGSSNFTKVSHRGAYAIIQDKKGNIWTTGEVNQQVWALSRYDAKSLYNKKPTVKEIVSEPPAYLGLLEANDGSIWFGSGGGVYCYDGKTITDFKNKDGQK